MYGGVWNDTRQGYDFWERISKLWEDKNIRIQREDIEILYNKE